MPNENDKAVVNGDSRKKADEEETTSTSKPTVREFLKNFSLWRLVDPKEPWVLVEEGSFLGYFDWVPRPLRVGPWSFVSICYLFAIYYATGLALVYYGEHPWASIDDRVLNAYSADSHAWRYNLIMFFWMLFVNYLVLLGPLTHRAWSTYTVQSWTLLWLRHGLCVLAPFADWAARWAEYIRFPVACSATVTFVVWNFVLMPTIYHVGMKTAEKKRNFLKFCFSFRLLQLHGFNLAFCVLNVLWASPARSLEVLDLLAAIVSVLVYVGWYLCCLDRLGIHLYPVFSPRIGWLVLSTWTCLLVVYMTTFWGWQRILKHASMLHVTSAL